MAGVDNTPSTWVRSLIFLQNGKVVELDTMAARPEIKLVFMNLPGGGDDGDDSHPNNTNALYNLFENYWPSLRTIIPFETPVTAAYDYTREDLINGLAELIQRFQPFIVRTLDPQPFSRGSFAPQSCTDQPPRDFVSYDNVDHTYTARFAHLALDRYQGPGGLGHVTVQHYMAYSVNQHLGNLGPVEYTLKRGIADAYKKWDHNYRDTENCFLGNFGATYYRYPNNTTWLKKQANGLLAAFAVQNRRVVLWLEDSVGGAWTGPIALGGPPVAPHLAVEMRPDGRLQVFALKLTPEQEHAPEAVPIGAPILEIITSIQGRVGGQTFGAWQGLGNPDSPNCPAPQSCWFAGVPAVAANADGRLEVFAKNSLGGVSTTWELPGGGWSGWLDLGGGPEILDGLAAITTRSGRIEVFATTRFGRIAHWLQVAPNDMFEYDPTFPTPEVQITSAVSPPTVTFNQDGRLVTRNGQVCAAGSAFRRGDANADGNFDISDPIVILNYLFTGASNLSCLSAADANDDGQADLTDAIGLLGWRFLGDPPPPPPFPDCALDPTRDRLACDRFEKCGHDPVITNSFGMKLIYLQPGGFMMGTPNPQAGDDSDEIPHQVNISRGFYMGATEVTQAQYLAVQGINPSYFNGGRDETDMHQADSREIQGEADLYSPSFASLLFNEMAEVLSRPGFEVECRRLFFGYDTAVVERKNVI
ncbi:MAG: SUMF1/EgtB/PvdO family nonheme iron enzyme [Planctomycetes bacterium]|nr:SUMF1/EgtB/PvdO family nonheme iron enzyme [Planctomycetota bacterium]